jgi:hypothetical protein
MVKQNNLKIIMRMGKRMNTFDIKLKDGRYFKNINIVTEIMGIEDNVEMILDHEYTDEDGIVKVEMDIYKESDDEGLNCLAKIFSDDIEYICESYKHKRSDK